MLTKCRVEGILITYLRGARQGFIGKEKLGRATAAKFIYRRIYEREAKSILRKSRYDRSKKQSVRDRARLRNQCAVGQHGMEQRGVRQQHVSL